MRPHRKTLRRITLAVALQRLCQIEAAVPSTLNCTDTSAKSVDSEAAKTASRSDNCSAICARYAVNSSQVQPVDVSRRCRRQVYHGAAPISLSNGLTYTASKAPKPCSTWNNVPSSSRSVFRRPRQQADAVRIEEHYGQRLSKL